MFENIFKTTQLMLVKELRIKKARLEYNVILLETHCVFNRYSQDCFIIYIYVNLVNR